MAKYYFAALLTLCAAPVQAQPASPAVSVQPFVDTPQQRQALRKLSACLADARPQWARQTLAHPYLSQEQAKAAAEALSGKDTCIQAPEAELTFRTSSMVGNLAEHFLRAGMGKAELNGQALAKALNTLPSLNASEDFALCVASRDPAAARNLAISDPGSVAETEAAAKVTAHVPNCTDPREKMTVDLQSLRALVSMALYRVSHP